MMSKMLNCLGLSDLIWQCDPEPSLLKWADSVKSKTSRANSHPKFSQTITSGQRISGINSETVTGTGARDVGQHFKTARNTDRPLTVH